MKTKEEMTIALIFGQKNLDFADGITDYLYLYFADWLDIKFKQFSRSESYRNFIQKYSKSILDLSDFEDTRILYGDKRNLEAFQFIVKQNLSIDLSFVK